MRSNYKTESKYPIVVFTKDPCPYCDRLLQLLKNFNYSYEERDLTDHPDEWVRIKDETGWRTFPIAVVHDQVIGGYTDMKELHDRGELQKLIQGISS